MKYIILSLEHGHGKAPIFWKADCVGYTPWPFDAGIYDEKEINDRPDYFNNGFSALAIPLTSKALKELGFQCSYNQESIINFLQKVK